MTRWIKIAIWASFVPCVALQWFCHGMLFALMTMGSPLAVGFLLANYIQSRSLKIEKEEVESEKEVES